MKASELISKLQELIEEYGDQDIVDMELEDIEEVEFDEFLEAFLVY